MISAGDGDSRDGLSQLHAGSATDSADLARAATDRRDSGQLVRAVPEVELARPPAVAVFGLRRSGRTGDGEGPRGCIAPAYQSGPLSTHPIPVCGARPGLPAPPSARRAPRALENVEKILTGQLGTLCAVPLDA